MKKLTNKTVQATAAKRSSFTFAFSHIAVVADASASPAAMPELNRWTTATYFPNS